jgi:hypothetical protein
MGASTIMVLRKGVTIEQIAVAMEAKYGEVTVYPSRSKDFFTIGFVDDDIKKNLSIIYGDCTLHDYGIDGVYGSLSCINNSVEIAKYLCETFGGYLDEDDCDDEPFYPINIELFMQGSEMTAMDEFRHEVITSLGYKNLKRCMELLEKYSSLVKRYSANEVAELFHELEQKRSVYYAEDAAGILPVEAFLKDKEIIC